MIDFNVYEGRINCTNNSGSKHYEGVVHSVNGELVSFIPNWFTKSDIENKFPGIKDPQEILDMIEDMYGDMIADEVGEIVYRAAKEVINWKIKQKAELKK